MDSERILFSSVSSAPLYNLTWRGSDRIPVASQCEIGLQMGIFFDGTENNIYKHRETGAHTNVARLYEIYEESGGIRAVYVPGIGTPCPEIGENNPKLLGSAIADGGMERIWYAFFLVINTIYFYAKGKPYFNEKNIITAIKSKLLLVSCNDEEGKVVDLFRHEKSQKNSRMIKKDKKKLAEFVFGDLSKRIECLLQNHKPAVKELHLDIFGFSRGAAQARVFCNLLNTVMENGKFCGVTIRIRFLGLFDTVASVGWSVVEEGIEGDTRGHATGVIIRI